MDILVLSHLLMSGERSVSELAGFIGISVTYASQVTDGLADNGFVVKERRGKRVLVRPNMESPFVQDLSKFVVLVGGYPPYTPRDFLRPASRRRALWELGRGDRTIQELMKGIGCSRVVVYDALRPLLKCKIVRSVGKRGKSFGIDHGSPLARPLLSLIEFLESDMDLRPFIEKMSSDGRIAALAVFGSQASGTKDRLSDVDLFLIVRSPKDRHISKEYARPRIQFNVYSRSGAIQLAREEPWFLKLALGGRVLKGRDILEALMEVPARADYAGVAGEIRKMLGRLNGLRRCHKARVLMYCIRTVLAMRLYQTGELDQDRFLEELVRNYPEFRMYRADPDRMTSVLVNGSKKKILEDIGHVEKAQEEGR